MGLPTELYLFMINLIIPDKDDKIENFCNHTSIVSTSGYMDIIKNKYGDHEGGVFPFHHGIYGYEEVITICLAPTKYVKLYQAYYLKISYNTGGTRKFLE